MSRRIPMHSMVLLLAWIGILATSNGASGNEPLDPACLPADWMTLFEGLRSHHPLRADFLETRKLPFRRAPIVFAGTLRLDDSGGLSLHYPEADGSPVTVIDAAGMATRSRDGPWRSLPDRRSIRAVHGAIAALLTLDFERLHADFDLSGVLEDGNWIVHLSPKPGSDTGRLKELSIRGSRNRVTHIHIGLGGDLGILIEILREELVACFEPEENARYFR